ncbi:MAG: thermonuclease family protein [Armatimonadetes bacterium]|nr:thermonuclease family protein [Armatimonadota bacterium]
MVKTGTRTCLCGIVALSPRLFLALALLSILLGAIHSLLKLARHTDAKTAPQRLWRTKKASESYGVVISVIDGDTVRLLDGRIVRYIGIDAPERSQPFYMEAKRENEKLVLRKRVHLQFDVQRKDQHGRWLAYVFVKTSGREIFVNAELVKRGYAMAYTVPPNVRYADLFVRLQREAVRSGKGLWREQRDRIATYIGNKRTLIFHRPTCKYAREISQPNRVVFRSRKGSMKAGYRPCKACQP